MPEAKLETWLAELSTTSNAAHAASLHEIKADARRAGLIAQKRKPADALNPVKGFYNRILENGWRRILVRDPKRLVIARGFADDRVYISFE